MLVLIPMAGAGTRFSKAGYVQPKPFIPVRDGKPMIQCVLENLNFRGAHYIFIMQEDYLKNYGMKFRCFVDEVLLERKQQTYSIITVKGLTEGAAQTALAAKNLINTHESLLIANSDQIVKYSKPNFEILTKHTNADAAVWTFNAASPKWSYIKVDSEFNGTEVAEKKPISNIATCGIYWYARSMDFLKYAEQMIAKDIRVNNEYYIAPVYNELIQDGKTLIPFYVEKMWGIGTPADLEQYLLLGD